MLHIFVLYNSLVLFISIIQCVWKIELNNANTKSSLFWWQHLVSDMWCETRVFIIYCIIQITDPSFYREKKQKTGDWYSHLRLRLRIWFLSFLGNAASNRTHFDPQRVLQFTRARPATKAQSQLDRSTIQLYEK